MMLRNHCYTDFDDIVVGRAELGWSGDLVSAYVRLTCPLIMPTVAKALGKRVYSSVTTAFSRRRCRNGAMEVLLRTYSFDRH